MFLQCEISYTRVVYYAISATSAKYISQNFSDMTLLFSRDFLQPELSQECNYRVTAEQSVLI